MLPNTPVSAWLHWVLAYLALMRQAHPLLSGQITRNMAREANKLQVRNVSSGQQQKTLTNNSDYLSWFAM